METLFLFRDIAKIALTKVGFIWAGGNLYKTQIFLSIFMIYLILTEENISSKSLTDSDGGGKVKIRQPKKQKTANIVSLVFS